ncbi:MAG TPA: gliding motility-associated C-terminal domain-containing protein [Bacteroidales bacterium]|nr:gliding motility-associated C-terminal domain-containing protein [Bacteroidales bacterium]HPS18048.1 gliding motility-associated C-terminal domain-containing protein [Bacteroidales bacterium]
MKNNFQYFLVFIFILLFSQTNVFAQPGCPSINAGTDQTVICTNNCATLTSTYLATGETTSYTVSSIPYTPPNPYNSGNAILVNADDVWSSIVNLPFNFCFFGTSYNKIVVGANGLISFDTTYAGNTCQYYIYSTYLIPTTSVPENSILGPYQDIDPTYKGGIYWQLIGNYPCRMLVVSYYQIPYYGDPNSISTSYCDNAIYATSQIVLYESTNVIEIYIQNKETCTNWNDGLAIEGIQNSTGTIAYPISGRNCSVWTATNDAWRFTPNGTQNYVVSWWQGSTQLATGATTTVCPSTATTYTAKIAYTNCDATVVTVTDDVLVNVSSNITASASANPTSVCPGFSSTLTATGTAGSTFAWSSGETSATTTVTPTSTTTYTVTATDGGCTATAQVTVNTLSPPTIQITTTLATCGLSDGSATATGGGTYAWSTNPTQTTATASGIPAGTYTVTVTGTNGCTATASALVTNIYGPTATASSTPATCGLNNGSVTVNATGGTGGYTYSWNTSPVQTTQTVSNLAAGTYTVTVTDQMGCSATNSVTLIDQPAPMATIANIINATCELSNGAISVTTTSGTAPLAYSWNTPTPWTLPTLSNIPGGTYTVTVTDANGCTDVAIGTISTSYKPTASASSTNEICNRTNGTIAVIANGGSEAYTYLWSNNATTANVTDLPAGTYDVIVSDSNGCTASATTRIINIPGPIADFSIHPQVLTLMDGPVLFSDNSSGNVENWYWTFGDGDTASSFNKIQHQYDNIGTFTVTLVVIDDNGCFDTIQNTVRVTETYTIYTPNCFTPNDDGLNDTWSAEGTNVDPNNFELTIFDRWGKVMFNTTNWDVIANQSEGWNGTFNNAGNYLDVVMGVYIYLIQLKEIDGPKHEYIGKISLIP